MRKADNLATSTCRLSRIYRTLNVLEPYGPAHTCIVFVLESKRNVMAHAQKTDLVFQRNGRIHLYRRGCQFSRLLAAEVCASAVVMLDRECSDTVQDCWLPTPFASSLLLPCVIVCHQIPFPLYIQTSRRQATDMQ